MQMVKGFVFVSVSLIGFAVAGGAGCASKAESAAGLCKNYCSKAAKVCSKFDAASCNTTCDGTPNATPQTSEAIDPKCKKQAEAYGNCNKNADLTCEDDQTTPKAKGCESQWDAVLKCAGGGASGGSEDGTSNGSSSGTDGTSSGSSSGDGTSSSSSGDDGTGSSSGGLD